MGLAGLPVLATWAGTGEGAAGILAMLEASAVAADMLPERCLEVCFSDSSCMLQLVMQVGCGRGAGSCAPFTCIQKGCETRPDKPT